MFFFIAGLSEKLVGKEMVKVDKNGFSVNAEVKIFKNYISLFFIPIIPIGRKYSIYIPHSDEYYDNGAFNNMPAEYLRLCKEVGAKY